MTTDIDTLVASLLELCVDWNGEEIVDGSTPRTETSCGQLRQAAATIRTLQTEKAELREALNRAQADLAYIERMPTHGMNDQSYINAIRASIGEAMMRIRQALSNTGEME